MTEIQAFIEGWQTFQSRVIATIEEYSQGWTPNGPSKAAAEAIKNKIRSIPTPVPERTRP